MLCFVNILCVELEYVSHGMLFFTVSIFCIEILGEGVQKESLNKATVCNLCRQESYFLFVLELDFRMALLVSMLPCKMATVDSGRVVLVNPFGTVTSSCA